MNTTIKTHNRLAITFLAGLFCFLFLHTSAAQAGLTIFPLKIVMGERDRFAEIHLFNTAKKETSYRLEWRFHKQTPEGQYEQIDESITPEFDLSEHLVFTPRRVTLLPDGRQTIRLALRKKGEVPPGEYRAHLLVQSYEGGGERSKIEGMQHSGKGATVAAKVFPGYTFPIIFRAGEYDSKVEIKNVRFDPDHGDKRLLLTLAREGLHGATGNLRAYHLLPDQKPVEVGLKNNVNLFTEITHRNTNIHMTKTGLSGGNLHIVYNGEGPQKGEVLAETIIPLEN